VSDCCKGGQSSLRRARAVEGKGCHSPLSPTRGGPGTTSKCPWNATERRETRALRGRHWQTGQAAGVDKSVSVGVGVGVGVGEGVGVDKRIAMRHAALSNNEEGGRRRSLLCLVVEDRRPISATGLGIRRIRASPPHDRIAHRPHIVHGLHHASSDQPRRRQTVSSTSPALNPVHLLHWAISRRARLLPSETAPLIPARLALRLDPASAPISWCLLLCRLVISPVGCRMALVLRRQRVPADANAFSPFSPSPLLNTSHSLTAGEMSCCPHCPSPFHSNPPRRAWPPPTLRDPASMGQDTVFASHIPAF
jgi:hypothetical protein